MMEVVEPSGKRLFLLAVVVSLCATAGLAILILLFGDFGETEARILGTTGVIGVFSLLSLPGGVLLDQGRARPLAIAVLVLCAAGFVTALAALWGDVDDDDFWKSLLTVTLVAVACSQTAATTSRLRSTDSASVRRLYVLSVVGAFVAAAMGSFAAWAEVDDDGYYRILGAVAVADLLVVLLQPVLRRAAGVSRAPAHHALRVTVDGREIQVEREAADFASAVAAAIRDLERDGGRVERIERA